MDHLDIRIIGQLARNVSNFGFQVGPRGAYSKLAKNLGADEDTVRKRVAKMKEDGLLRGWRLTVNPNILGLGIYAIWFTKDPGLTPDEAMRKLKLVQGVAYLTCDVAGVVGVGILAPARTP